MATADVQELELLVIPGDGIGREVTDQACRIAEWFIGRGMRLRLRRLAFGLEVWEHHGCLMTEETLQAIRASRAILFGAIGGDAYDDIPLDIVRSQGLLRIRKELDLYANLRPVRAWPSLEPICPLVPALARGVDLLIVRELADGLYYGEPRGIVTAADGARTGINTMSYGEASIRRIARAALEIAATRSGRLTSVDKSNVLETSQLWRRVMQEEAAARPEVAVSHMLVDNCALQLMRRPGQFDVIVTENLFGDILSDEAGAIAGSLGMLPSASLRFGEAGTERQGLYEPVHGSAPDIAGRDIANPLGAILSLALAFRFSLDAPQAADLLEAAVEVALADGARTLDIMHAGGRQVDCAGMGDAVLAALDTLAPAARGRG